MQIRFCQLLALEQDPKGKIKEGGEKVCPTAFKATDMQMGLLCTHDPVSNCYFHGH